MRKSLVKSLMMGAVMSGGLYADIFIQNNSFEIPGLSGNYIYYSGGNTGNSSTSINGWTYTSDLNGGGGGIASGGSGFGPATPIPDGNQVLFLQNVSSAYQLLSGFQAGELYTLSFYAAERGYGSGTPQLLNVTIGGQNLFTSLQAPSSSSYTLETAQFTATSPETLTFAGTVGGPGVDTTVFADDVLITASPTPEPG